MKQHTILSICVGQLLLNGRPNFRWLQSILTRICHLCFVQAIAGLVDVRGWRFSQALLEAGILSSLSTVITSTTKHLGVCCTATEAASRLGSWKYVQVNNNALVPLASHSSALTTLLLAALANTSSSICIELSLRGAPVTATWKHGCLPSALLDESTALAVDTLNDLYPTCNSNMQSDVLKAIAQVIKAGALSETCKSLASAMDFLERHFCIRGKYTNTGTRPECPNLSSKEATLLAAAASVQLITWRYEKGWEGPSLRAHPYILMYMANNASFWTPEVLGHIMAGLVKILSEGPVQATMKKEKGFNMLAEGSFHLLSALQGLSEIIKPHPSTPWDSSKTDWSTSKECEALETSVVLEALKAGALQAVLRIYPCLFRHKDAHTVVKELTGSSPHSLRSLTNIRSGKDWESVLPHLVEAVGNLTDWALATPGEESDEEEVTMQIVGTQATVVKAPRKGYPLISACKLLAEVSALHQQELQDLASSASLPAHTQPSATEAAAMQSLHATFKKVLSRISELLSSREVSEALPAAPLMAALLGSRMLTATPLSYIADTFLKNGAMKLIGAHMRHLASSEDGEGFKQMMGVLVVLAKRNPEAHSLLMPVGNLSLMLKMAKKTPVVTGTVLDFLQGVVPSEQVHEVLKKGDVLGLMQHVCQVCEWRC